MKVGITITILLLAFGMAKAGDESCQAELLKPKYKAPLIEEEENKPGALTVAEARIRLLQSRQVVADIEAAEANNDSGAVEEEQPTPEEDSEVANEAAKKESRLGGIFDILLQSKLRNPVK